jgi:hypothetical protein
MLKRQIEPIFVTEHATAFSTTYIARPCFQVRAIMQRHTDRLLLLQHDCMPIRYSQQAREQPYSAITCGLLDQGQVVVKRVKTSGADGMRGVTYQIGRQRQGQTVYVVEKPATIAFHDQHGLLIIEHPWPAPGVKHVSNNRRRGADSQHHLRDGEQLVTVRQDGKVSVGNVTYRLFDHLIGVLVAAIWDEHTISF